MQEIWKDIKGYEGYYQVSNLGRVKSLNYNHTSKEKILSPAINKKGYYVVSLSETTYVHKLVAETFLPNPDNLPCVNHKDENKQNNVVWINEDGSIDFEKTNLEWCTYKYNINYGTSVKRASIKKINGKKAKTVLQYDLEGNLIKEWPSVNEIERTLGFRTGNICSCCNGCYKQAYGYIWKYK